MRLFYGFIQIIIWQPCVLFKKIKKLIKKSSPETVYSAKKLARSVQQYVFHIAQRENLSSFIAELHLIWPKISLVK